MVEASRTSPDTHDLVDLLALCHVPRWGILPMLRHQTVAEHSFRVAILTHWMLANAGLSTSQEALVYALAHDAEEARTGDIPGPAKRRLNEVVGYLDHLQWAPDQSNAWGLGDDPDHQPTEFTRLLVKLADLVEAATWLQRYGSDCDHKQRVIVELWKDVDKVALGLDAVSPPATMLSWWDMAQAAHGAMVYEHR